MSQQKCIIYVSRIWVSRSHLTFENSKFLYEQKCDKNMYYTFAHVCKISLLLTLL
jgi:hypothetical protein